MVYENITYEVILERMINRMIEKRPDIDTREGSIIYDAVAPAAVELQLMYIEFDIILTETFGDTASRDYLIRRARERGIKPYPATFALLKGEFDMEIPIGSRFSLNELNYYAKENLNPGIYSMECEVSGTVGNQYFGDLIPIDYIDGLGTAKLTELLIPGEDEEGTEELRQRYFSSFDTKPYGGNQKDYEEKTNSIPGVGSTKVTPIWNGGGTVLLTILNSEFNKATPTLIDTVQEEIDPTQTGEGFGVAPIGHIVTVDTATEVTINISSNFTFDYGFGWDTLESQVIEIIDNYLLELRIDWSNNDNLIVRLAQIDTRLLAIEGIVDIEGTSINSIQSNLTLNKYQIPILGGVSS